MSKLSRRGLAALAFALALSCVVPEHAAAEDSGTTAAKGALQPNTDALPDLEEARSENTLFRFEIVTLGSLPFALFYSDLGFDLYRYSQHIGDEDGGAKYFPVFNSIVLTDDERLSRLGVALGLSAGIGLTDAVIHFIKVNEAKRRHAAPPEAPPAVSPISSPESPTEAPPSSP